jgi:opacity protein-like surface antigen
MNKTPAPSRSSMLKSVILFLTVLSFPMSIFASCCPEEPFSGFNVSAAVGMNVPNISTTGDLEAFVPNIQNTTFNVFRRTTNTALNGGIRLGYNYVYNRCFLLGLAADANFTCNHMEFNAQVSELASQLTIPVDSHIKLKNQYALLLKLGQLIGTRTLIYGLIGPQWGKFNFLFETSFFQDLGGTIIESDDLIAKDNPWKTGVLLGIGTETLLTSCLSLALEYTHSYYGSYKLATVSTPIVNGVLLPESALTLSNRFNLRINTITLRLVYYF